MGNELAYTLKLQASAFKGPIDASTSALTKFTTAINGATARLTGLTAGSNKAAASADNMSKSYSGFFSKIAGFGAASAAGFGLLGLVKRGLAFNKTMGDSKIAIANVLRQFKGLSKEGASKQASAAMEQLVKLEPQAAGTLQELTAGFLSTVAASQAVGISVEENIDLVGKFSNALGNANIDASQLSQEMRSILTGNIGADSSLARVLGITNEMVNSARAAGNLYGFLSQKIGLMGESGDTAAVSISTLNSAIDKAAGLATKGMFDEMIGGAKDLTAAVDENADSFENLGASIGVLVGWMKELGGWAYDALDAIQRVRFAFLGDDGDNEDFFKKMDRWDELKESAKAERKADREGSTSTVESKGSGPPALSLADQLTKGNVVTQLAPPELKGKPSDKLREMVDFAVDPAEAAPPVEGRERIKGYRRAQYEKNKFIDHRSFNELFHAEETAAGQRNAKPLGKQSFEEFFKPTLKSKGGIQPDLKQKWKFPGLDALKKPGAIVNPGVTPVGKASRNQQRKEAEKQAAKAATPRWDSVVHIEDMFKGLGVA